ncbi:MAG: hypothetical protein EKK55_17425 [Rhodocyclaceae bacterium]|nr:MAG: hypothetical protein EKK55_17425 [Rhodocyclaceae bacterium]
MKLLLLCLVSLAGVSANAIGFGGGGGAGGSIGSTITITSVGTNETSMSLTASGSTVVVITTSPGNGKILVPNSTITERPSIASIGFPTTGMHYGNTTTDVIINNNSTHQFSKSGDGYFNMVMMGSMRKDGDGHLYPRIHSEINHDGINWVDNRLPDGTVGHDLNGRFIDYEIGGATKFRVGVSSAGFFTGTNPMGGRLAIGASNAQFVIDGSTATGSGTVSLGTASPAATSSTPKWVKFRLCNSSGGSCANYYIPMWAE